jgi:hypothetical protein
MAREREKRTILLDDPIGKYMQRLFVGETDVTGITGI